MKRYGLAALIVPVMFSANAFAGHRDNDRHKHRYHHRVERVVVYPAYVQPEVVYHVAPQVIYRNVVVYREPPVYYEEVPGYRQPPRHYRQPEPYPAHNGNRIMAQTIGAVAGAVIGNRLGHGDGRVLTTAAGAVVGGVVGGSLAGY